jgi:RNA polymerase primary sigma factor
MRETGREPTPEKISPRYNIDPDRVRTLMQITREPISLDMPTNEEYSSLADVIEDANAVSPQEAVIKTASEAIAENTLLPPLPGKRGVLRLRFGIDTKVDLTIKEVGQSFSVTRERVQADRGQRPQEIVDPLSE